MFDPWFIAVAATAIIMVGLSKSGLLSGLGVVGVPLLSLIMPAREAAGIMLPILLVMDAIAIYAYRQQADWRLIKIMIPGALLGTAIGWAIFSVVSDAVVLLLVGVITLIFVLDATLPLRAKLNDLPPSTLWGRVWGTIAGFTSFISHTGGPPFQIYVLPQRLPPAFYAGTSAFFFAIVNVSKLVPYFFLGQLSLHNLQLSLLLAPLGMASVLLGVFLVRRISAKHFYTIAYTLVFALALKLIWDSTTTLLT